MDRALDGIKVVDLTRVLAGPYATTILADMGARVIHVEIPVTGDDSRGFGPYVNGESCYFMSLNRNKEGITLNMKSDEGKEILKKLIMDADILVENFKPGTMEKLGFGYEDVVKWRPDIIYAACSGYGHTGPFASRPAYDAVVQAMGGLMSITSHEPGGEPTRVGASIGDILAGIFTSVGILAALHHKDKTGEGQKVDVGMLDCQVAILENAVIRYFATGVAPGPVGNRHASITPFEPFKCADGIYLVIAAGNDKLWATFCNLVKRVELIEDERFKTNALRTENHSQLKPIMDEIMGSKSSGEWMEIFESNDIPCTTINTIDKVINHPQVVAREMIAETYHPKVGVQKLANLPIKFSKTPGAIYKAAPLLGEDNERILKELGYSGEDILRFKVEGII
ncbi:MAG: CoA transferase [Defluviitaleaceae bacterium]|nr:CoA transferase [Defluviitaleaceae bacterium]